MEPTCEQCGVKEVNLHGTKDKEYIYLCSPHHIEIHPEFALPVDTHYKYRKYED